MSSSSSAAAAGAGAGEPDPFAVGKYVILPLSNQLVPIYASTHTSIVLFEKLYKNARFYLFSKAEVVPLDLDLLERAKRNLRFYKPEIEAVYNEKTRGETIPDNLRILAVIAMTMSLRQRIKKRQYSQEDVIDTLNQLAGVCIRLGIPNITSRQCKVALRGYTVHTGEMKVMEFEPYTNVDVVEGKFVFRSDFKTRDIWDPTMTLGMELFHKTISHWNEDYKCMSSYPWFYNKTERDNGQPSWYLNNTQGELVELVALELRGGVDGSTYFKYPKRTDDRERSARMAFLEMSLPKLSSRLRVEHLQDVVDNSRKRKVPVAAPPPPPVEEEEIVVVDLTGEDD